MPYVLVETNDVGGRKELLAAPATWIQQHANGTSYLRWPNVRNVNMLNALLADDRSPPMAAWETYKCAIKCSNIQNLAMAGKMIKTLQTHWNTSGMHAQKRTIKTDDDDDVTVSPVSKKSPTSGRQQQHQQESFSEEVSNVAYLEERDEPNEVQLIGMLDELGSLIKKRHDDARRKLLDGFYRVEKSLQSVMSEAERRVEDNLAQRSLEATNEEFCVNPLTCAEEMVDFEERLNDEDYRKEVERWIDCTIGCESNPDYRMRIILDALFDREFLMKFSWTGSGQDKLSFGKHNNIVNLFNYAGTTDRHLATPRYVAQFFKQRLKRIATQRTGIDVSKSASPRSSVTNEDNSTQNTIESLDELPSQDSLSDEESSAVHQAVPKFSPTPFTCVVEVDDFEAFLNNAEYLKQVHKWVNENVAFEVNPDARMMEILYLLFDKNFLPSFTWIGAKKGSYGMVKYKNIIKLFQYIATTAAHQADYGCVENFFTRKLRYAGRRADQ